MIPGRVRVTLDLMTEQLIDVPPGLHGVVAADTAIGAVHGDEGYFHYGAYDAIELARTRSFEEVWWLIREGRLPSADELAQFRRSLAEQRRMGLHDPFRDRVDL